MWCWRRMEKISWTDHVRNKEVLLRVNEQRNILHEMRKRKANLIGHILRRNCILKQVIERKIKGEMEVTRRRGRRRKKLLYDLKDRRGYSHVMAEALDRTMWRNRFRGEFGPVVRILNGWETHCLVFQCHFYDLKMNAVRSSELSIHSYQAARHHPKFIIVCACWGCQAQTACSVWAGLWRHCDVLDCHLLNSVSHATLQNKAFRLSLKSCSFLVNAIKQMS